MANTVTLLSYANTYGDWMVTTNQLIQENNNFATGIYNKNSGTLYLNDSTLGLQVTSNAIFAGQLQVSGVGSSAYVQNNLRVDGALVLTNTRIGISTPGIIYANGPNNGIIVANNATVANTLYAANVNVGGVDLSTYIDNNSQGLRANDFSTLILADNHINQANNYLQSNIASRVATSTVQVQNLIDANNATAYVKGMVVGSGGFTVGGSIFSNSGLSLDGVSISNGAIVFPAAGGTVGSNVSIRKYRAGGATNAEIKFTESKLYWEISDPGSPVNFPTKYTNDSFYRILTSSLLTDSVTLDFSTPSSATFVASANAANTLNNSIKTNLAYSTAAFSVANSALALASAGFTAANNAQDTWVRNQANSAFDKANVATVLAQAGFNVANTGLSTAQLAYTAANNALDLWVRGQANNAYNIGQSAYNYANTLTTYATIGFGRANTSTNTYVGTSGTAVPNTGVISYASDNGVTVVGSANTLTVSTPQDLRTTAQPTFNSLTLTNALSIGQGGTGATSQGQALTNLLPTGAIAGYILTTNGPGSYYWAQGSGGISLGGGTIVNSTRLQYTANGNGTAYTSPTYAPGSNQLRVYFDGVRQFDGYTETSNTIVSFTSKPAANVQILFEVDGYAVVPNYANVIPYTANSAIGLGANTIQLALDALINNVAFKGTTSLIGTPTAPTAANNAANTMIATTQYVQNVLGSNGLFVINITGNANTVNNGVYTTGSYTNPSWIVSLANTKILGNVVNTQITSIANTQITGNVMSYQIHPTGIAPGVYGNTNSHLAITVDAQGRIVAASNLTPNVANTQIFGLITASQLAPTTVTAGTYGGTTQHAVFVVDAQGRIIGASNNTPNVANSQIFGLITAPQLAPTTVTIGTYGGTTKHSVFTVDQQGRITSAANVDPSVANTQITGLITDGQIASISGSKVTGAIAASSIANTGITGLIRASQLENTTVTPGVYGGASVNQVFTVDQQGRLTQAANVAITIPTTALTGNVLASQIQPTGVSPNSYGGATLIPQFTVDHQGRITTATSITPSIANTQITGLITDSQLAGISTSKFIGTITNGQIASLDASKITSSITAGQIASIANTQITGTLTAAQLGTTSSPQFNSIGVGTNAAGTTGSINLAQNGYLRVGNTYISSGGDYVHISGHSWFNGTSWTVDAAVPHVLYQMSGNNATWYRGTASLTPSYIPTMQLNAGSGDLLVTGNVTGYGTISDIRMKENIVKLDGAMDKVSAINGYYFNYKSDENKARLIGVIAQEVEQVMPELVYEFNQIDTNEVTKAVRYEHLTAVLVEAIKELKQEIKDLKQEVDVLKGNNK